MKENLTNEFKNCIKAEDFIGFFDNDEQYKKHTYYYHYTKIETINTILKSKRFLLSNSKKANDKTERDKDSSLFSLCFATGTSENLPLWYLYSGVEGKGGRIGMSKKTFLKLIQKAKVYLIEYSDDTFLNEKKVKKLSEDEYELSCRDVLYIREDSTKSGVYRAKYKDEVVNGITQKEYEKIMESTKEKNIIIKGLIWFYEKETRIQVRIKNKQSVDKKFCKVALDIDSIVGDLTIRLAPEYDSEFEWEKYDGLKKWALMRIEKSAYMGEINMNLCNGCEKIKDCKKCEYFIKRKENQK